MKDVGMAALDLGPGAISSALTGKNISDFAGYEYEGTDLGKVVNTSRDITKVAAPTVANVIAPGSGMIVDAAQNVGTQATSGVNAQDSFITNSPEANAGLNFANSAASMFLGNGLPAMAYGGNPKTSNSNGGRSLSRLLTNFEGPTHEEANANGNQSIPLGNEVSVEGGETRVYLSDGEYVFSDRLNVADGKSFAEVSKTIQKRYGGKDREHDKLAKKGMLSELSRLRDSQESIKKEMGLSDDKQEMAFGGGIGDYLGSGNFANALPGETPLTMPMLDGFVNGPSLKSNELGLRSGSMDLDSLPLEGLNDSVGSGERGFGMTGTDALRSASILGSFLANESLNEKPDPLSLDTFNSPLLADQADIVVDTTPIDDAIGRTRSDLLNSGNMSGGSLRNNLIAANTSAGKIKSEAVNKARVANAEQDAKIDFANSDIISANNKMMLHVQNMNDMDEGQYSTNKINNVNNLSNNILGMATQMDNRKIANNLSLNYDSKGRYRPINGKKKGK